MRELLDRAVPPYTGPSGDWSAVLDDAGVAPHRRSRLRPALAVAVLATAAAVAVAWPFSAGPTSVVERALAATGTGDVLHLVLESEEPKTLVDLETGETREVRGHHEVWFDPARGFRERETFEGVTQWDTSAGVAEMHEHTLEVYGSLATGYRDALRTGKAEVVGDGVVDGIPVHWIRIAEGHDVAVSRETYVPVFIRVGDGGMRILTYETVDAAPLESTPVGGFTGPSPDGARISLAAAQRVLGRPVLWAGERFQGLRLTAVRQLDDGVKLIYGPSAHMRVEIAQATGLADGVTMMAGVAGYAPPEGTLLLAGPSGLVRADGLIVGLHGPDPGTVTAFVRALRRYDG